MTASIIHIAHDMGMEIIAEGVENQVQKNFLQEKSCDYIQGFYYSKPLTERELHSMYPNIFSGTDIHI